MVFPRAPKKPVVGQLKITIKSPDTAVEITTDPRGEFKDERDLSEQLKFKLPRGFNIVTETAKYMDSQKNKALLFLEELKSELENCKPCHRTMDKVAIEQAQELLEYCCSYLKDNSEDYIKLVAGHQKDGAITLNFAAPDRELAILVYQGSFELGRYFEGLLVDETEVRLISTQLMEHLEWLA